MLACTCLGFLTADPAAVRAAVPSGVRPQAVLPTIALPHLGIALRPRAGGQDGLFLFDTGGGVTIVTPTTARLLGCKPWGRMTGFRATGQRLDTPRCDDARLSLAGHGLAAPIAAVHDIDALVDPKAPTLSGSIALDLFAGCAITIRPLAHELVLETAASLARRTRGARAVPIRIVRDLEGVALSVDAAVPTASGRAWMELDTGNLGPILVGKHVARLLGLDPGVSAQPARFALDGGVPVRGPARVRDLIMDGDIGQPVLVQWDVTLDRAAGRAWLRPAITAARPSD